MLTRFLTPAAIGIIVFAAPVSASVTSVAGTRPFYGSPADQIINTTHYDTTGGSHLGHIEGGASNGTPLPGYQPLAFATSIQSNATAWASSNAETGAMRGYASSTNYGMASFENDLNDRLTFLVAGAAADAVTQVVLNISYRATISGAASHNMTIDLGAPFGGGSGGGRTSVSSVLGPILTRPPGCSTTMAR